MVKTFSHPRPMVIAMMLMVFAAHASTPAQDDYRAGKARISAEYKDDKRACATLKRNAKDICLVQAEGKRKIARAELEYGQTGAPADEERMQHVQAAAEYEIAKQKCVDLAGNGEDVCLKEAKAIKTKAVVEAKTNQKVIELKQNAAQEKREADFSVAVEKCEALRGDEKSSCITQAKGNFGKP